MGYMSRHGLKRSRPAELIPGTVSCISVRMDYWPKNRPTQRPLAMATWATCPLCLGRDYHKVLRSRLQSLRPDSRRGGSFRSSGFYRQRAGVGEGAGAQCRLGLDRQAHESDRSQRRVVFFLGRDLSRSALARRRTSTAHCGSCSACMPACPTGAIVAPIVSMHGAASPTSRSSWPAAFRWNFVRHRQSHLRLR